MDIIQRIIEERKKQKLSQEELGKMSGLARAYISRIELGNVDVSLSRIERILEALGYELTIRKKK
jgi:transcriptional regulator with XRE-family HTH domain